MRTACTIVCAAQLIDYAEPSVAQRKHGVSGEMAQYFFFRKKTKDNKMKKWSHKGRGLATCRRRKIDAMIAVELRRRARNSSHFEDSCRAVANGPVGPAMAGPIIEPVLYFYYFLFLFYFFPAAAIIEPVIFIFAFFLYRVAINDF